MNSILQIGYDLLDRGLIPDCVLRAAIRMLLRQRLREINTGSLEANHAAKMKWIEDVRSRTTIADVPEKANEQHYEVSTEFILSTLGPYGKYSSCLYPTGKESLAEAEKLMLESYCIKAQLRDGLDFLDLGCGWGSLSLFLAEKYPNSRITGLSNSATQKQHIDGTAKARGLTNIEIITADVNTHDFDKSNRFDRILTIEMFEHMKNYQALFKKVSTWLRPKANAPLSDIQAEGFLPKNENDEEAEESLLFIHIFCHKSMPYHFVEDDGWMAKNFFSGGTMPSHDLFLYFQSDLVLLRNWYLPGTHYSRTCEDWLRMQDNNSKKGLKELEKDAVKKGQPAIEGRKAYNRFRVFYMACSELFRTDGGDQYVMKMLLYKLATILTFFRWGVGHYLFKAR
ncbi:S-adenosyl-L-methionine-dependent methyltransferase [Pholiota molesta]|nr:S-adenosyl-L-methionine-dependent methyltransferase [Pholiota molesta]